MRGLKQGTFLYEDKHNRTLHIQTTDKILIAKFLRDQNLTLEVSILFLKITALCQCTFLSTIIPQYYLSPKAKEIQHITVFTVAIMTQHRGRYDRKTEDVMTHLVLMWGAPLLGWKYFSGISHFTGGTSLRKCLECDCLNYNSYQNYDKALIFLCYYHLSYW